MIICSDKTGTLTKNEMTVRAYQLDGRRIEVTGAGYRPEGEFLEDGKRLDAKTDEHLALALRIGSLCNDAKFDGKEGRLHGDPTEGALLVAAEKAGMKQADVQAAYPRLSEVPFSSQAKRMVTVQRTPEGKTVAYVKGAPGVILDASERQFTASGIEPLTAEQRKDFLRLNEELAGKALRVLGLAYRELPAEHDVEALESDYVFVGLVGMIDPLRDEAKEAIARCREAGIRVIMLTGDQLATAREIGRQLGLDRDSQGRELKTVHARELANLDAAGWRRITREAGVFARVAPEDKLRIVEGLEAEGEIVAMTGDGVNDAPALKKADIGIAMGIKGTDVAKEASAMIILDDNFATIVSAVEQGRIIYANILRFIHYLFSCNFSEILVVFFAILVGWPLPLAALQVLWLNLVTDVFPALSLALEPSSPDAMKRPPRDPKEALLGRDFIFLIAWQGMLLAATTFGVFGLGLGWYGTTGAGLDRAVTLAFMTLALAQVVHVFSARSQNRSIFTRRLFTNGWLWAAVGLCVLLQLAAVYWPFLQTVLHTTPLGLADWGVIMGAILLPVAVIEAVKVASWVRRAPG
jgi:Ca2+-transporting ATPase